MVIMSADDSPLNSDICHNTEKNEVECLQQGKCLKETSDQEEDWFNSFTAAMQANDLSSIYALLCGFIITGSCPSDHGLDFRILTLGSQCHASHREMAVMELKVTELA